MLIAIPGGLGVPLCIANDLSDQVTIVNWHHQELHLAQMSLHHR